MISVAGREVRRSTWARQRAGIKGRPHIVVLVQLDEELGVVDVNDQRLACKLDATDIRAT
jgi:hypothetical protein